MDNGLYAGITLHSEISITTAWLLEASLWSPFNTSCLYAPETCGEKNQRLTFIEFCGEKHFLSRRTR